MFIPVIVVLVLLGAYVMATYNKFATLRTQIEASVQDIGNQLKRQASLIPNLESAAKGFMKQEKTIFKQLTDARKQAEAAVKSGSMKAIESAQDMINQVLPKIQVLVEDNPELKSDKVVAKLMDELRDTADKLMYARRTLIDLAQDFNQMLVVFPSSFIGNLFGMKKEKGIDTPMSGDHVEVSEAETKDVKIDLG